MNLTRSSIPQIISSIAGTTAISDFPNLVQLIEPLLLAKVGRKEAALEHTQQHSLSLRANIRKACGSLSNLWPVDQLASVIRNRMAAHPSIYGCVPSLKTIRSELAEMQKNDAPFRTEMADSKRYTLSKSST